MDEEIKTLLLFVFPVRSTLPTFVFEDQPPEHSSSSTHTLSPTRTHSLCVSWSGQADWLLRDSPYSEGVAEHRRGGTCQDCVRFHGIDGGDVPVSVTSDLLTRTVASSFCLCVV